MTFSYADPSASKKDSVRFLIQDTDPNQPFLKDEEIEWLLNEWSAKGSIYYVAARAAQSVAALLAREVSVSSDSQHVGLSELMGKYQTLAENLLAQDSSAGVGTVFVGGDAGVHPRGPLFSLGMHDNPDAGYQYGDFGQPHPEQWGLSIP